MQCLEDCRAYEVRTHVTLPSPRGTDVGRPSQRHEIIGSGHTDRTHPCDPHHDDVVMLSCAYGCEYVFVVGWQLWIPASLVLA